MNKMSPSEFNQKSLIRDIIDHPLFVNVIASVQYDLAVAMLGSKDAAAREALFNEAQAMTRLVGKLTSMANEVRMQENG